MVEFRTHSRGLMRLEVKLYRKYIFEAVFVAFIHLEELMSS